MKHILVGITGGIAAYKGAELVRSLTKAGYEVRVILTEAGKSFITPLTLQALSKHKVFENLLDPEQEAAMSHIDLARWADAIVIAPASANFLAEVATGEANDLLTTLILAADAPVYLAPAMNQQMWQNATTQTNAQTLIDRGYEMIGPGEGDQACGESGIGRMVEPAEILTTIQNARILDDKHVLITAGPTREHIDPVRHISNPSTGKMGYALAVSALRAGAKVTLISGPTEQYCPPSIKRINVTSAEEMHSAVMAEIASCDIFIAAAAVSDYRPTMSSDIKMKKTADAIDITLERTPDILSDVSQLDSPPFLVGFAAETHDIISYAKEKLVRKKLNMIIANDVSDPNSGFASAYNQAIIITQNQELPLERQAKTQLANLIINEISTRYHD